MNLIWLSDLHFSDTEPVLGHDSRARLRAAIEHINSHHSDANLCLISGDMTNHPSPLTYAELAAELAALQLPIFPMVGNHDDRQQLRTHLAVPDDCMAEFVQYEIDRPECLILCLDTLKPGASAGEFCDERKRWLESAIQRAADRSVIIFMHHPPMALGLPNQDEDRLEEGDASLDLIAAYPCVKHLFVGHVHRPTCGTVRGIPFASMRSVLFQAPAPRPAWSWDDVIPGAEAPNYGRVAVTEDTITLQFLQFSAHDQGVIEQLW